jgi:hypothetical protein
MQLLSNPSQHPKSLITGKFTGNFADSGSPAQFWRPVGEQFQLLQAKFPTQQNREFQTHFRENLSSHWDFTVR